MALRGSSFQSRDEEGGGEGERMLYALCTVCTVRVAPQGHITALIQFHVNLRVNATLIRWRVVAAAVVAAAAAAAKATPDPGLTCGTARFKCVKGTGRVRCAGAFKIIYNICENMFAKCQTTLSSAALSNFFLARPEKVCYSFFLSSLLFLVFPLFFAITCGLLRIGHVRVREGVRVCGRTGMCYASISISASVFVCSPPHLNTLALACVDNTCVTVNLCVLCVWQGNSCLPAPSLPACLPPQLRLWPHEIGVLLSTSWRAIQNSSKFAKTICKSTANTCKYWYDTVDSDCRLRNW